LSAPLTSRSESWPIPDLKVHFMGRDTGLPGNQWPDSAKFNSTLDFTVSLPDGPVTCHGDWIYTQVPTTPFTCSSANVEFQLGPTSAGTLTETAFVLSVTRTETDAGLKTTYLASQEVLANSPGQPDSYLSCVGGPPLDGIRCTLGGWAGTAGPLVLSPT
ncbi:hypothetical protein BDV96DRAFT_471333, partial [Lophiotrema nucula]